MSKYLQDWLDRNQAGYQKVISSKPFLHRNSQELVEILKDNNVLFTDMRIFEIGCGCGRNLFYIQEACGSAHPMGNDLNRKHCFNYMEDALKKAIEFKQIDTRSLFEGEPIKVDLFLSSDHMMHLDPDTAQFVIRVLCEDWRPQYIMLRETVVGRKKKPIKHTHDYSLIESAYDVLVDTRSAGDETYRILLASRGD